MSDALEVICKNTREGLIYLLGKACRIADTHINTTREILTKLLAFMVFGKPLPEFHIGGEKNPCGLRS